MCRKVYVNSAVDPRTGRVLRWISIEGEQAGADTVNFVSKFVRQRGEGLRYDS